MRLSSSSFVLIVVVSLPDLLNPLPGRISTFSIFLGWNSCLNDKYLHATSRVQMVLEKQTNKEVKSCSRGGGSKNQNALISLEDAFSNTRCTKPDFFPSAGTPWSYLEVTLLILSVISSMIRKLIHGTIVYKIDLCERLLSFSPVPIRSRQLDASSVIRVATPSLP